MKRREFITLLGGAAATWPLAARAQQSTVGIPRIGIIDDSSAWDEFRQGLRELGYVPGRNVALEYRSAEAKVDRLYQAALELAAVPVNVIVTYGSPATRAAQQATTTIPIVMIGIGDPVRAGFVTDLSRPNQNITGNSILGPDLIGKRLEILKECGTGSAIDFRSGTHEQRFRGHICGNDAETTGRVCYNQRRSNPAAHGADYRVHDTEPPARDVPDEGACSGWRAHVIWRNRIGLIQACRLVRAPDFDRG